ncbi:NADPH:quinone reductase-like Zn-dependent oxidoreductase [Microbacterium proteolyticum]|uniref:enoyl-[acyl-carrier-protein] reductase n=1 Tax=Microbacterium proteolyticum TaxID=1572644 RepID=A0A7W5GFJ4_9MICO|nr:zinc-binding dehydrogenase [Microbacterium proteolyticum]MBB3157900.1 NADPH:quinone reductase-like Zn-dependent oxidoreductase [Microbacterium proteolyticum]
MRAVIHHEFGEPADVLGVEEVETPTPGPGEVRLRVLLSPIHNHDLWTIRGTYGFTPELPARAGTEAVGVVDAVGEGVSLEVGQRVATGGTFGVWSEYVVTRAAGLIPVSDALSDEMAAQLVAMPFSAISLLHSLDLEPGDWIVQNTANGAVGRMVAQIAKARGIHVIGLVRRDSAVAELAEQGIDNVVSTDADDWRDKAVALADGAKIVAGVDSVGGSASNDVLSLLSENGTLVIFGSMGAGTLELSAGDIIFRQATVKGFWGSVVSKTMDADTRGALFGELSRYLADGTVTLPVAATFGLGDIVDAVTASDSPRVGKVLLRP